MHKLILSILLLSAASTVSGMEKEKIRSPKGIIAKHEHKISNFLGIDKNYQPFPKGSTGFLKQEATEGNAQAAFLLCLYSPYEVFGKSSELKESLLNIFPLDTKTNDPYYAGVSLLLSKEDVTKAAKINYHIILARLLNQSKEKHPLLQLVLSINNLDLEKAPEPLHTKDAHHQKIQMGIAYRALEDLANQGSLRAMYFLLYFATETNYAARFFICEKEGYHSINRALCYSKYLPKLVEYPKKHLRNFLVYLNIRLEDTSSKNNAHNLRKEISAVETTINLIDEKVEKKKKEKRNIYLWNKENKEEIKNIQQIQYSHQINELNAELEEVNSDSEDTDD